MIFRFLKLRKRHRLRARPFPSAWKSIITRNVPVYRRLPPAEQRELLGHIQIFLSEKHFEGCGGLELTDEIRVTIAAQACLLLLPWRQHPGARRRRPSRSHRSAFPTHSAMLCV
jgi:MtfA peptidase